MRLRFKKKCIISEIPLDLKHELVHHINSTKTNTANSTTTTTTLRPPGFDNATAALVAAAVASAGVLTPNSTGLTVKDLAALSYNAAAVASVGGSSGGGGTGADDDYGDYYDDDGVYGGGGVDPVDQSQVAKGKGILIFSLVVF